MNHVRLFPQCTTSVWNSRRSPMAALHSFFVLLAAPPSLIFFSPGNLVCVSGFRCGVIPVLLPDCLCHHPLLSHRAYLHLFPRVRLRWRCGAYVHVHVCAQLMGLRVMCRRSTAEELRPWFPACPRIPTLTFLTTRSQVTYCSVSSCPVPVPVFTALSFQQLCRYASRVPRRLPLLLLDALFGRTEEGGRGPISRSVRVKCDQKKLGPT